MEFTAILVKRTAIETISGQNGDWTQRTLVFKTIGDRFEREIAVVCRNDVATRAEQYTMGTLLKVQVDASSREYEGKYFTELRAWSIKPAYTVVPETHDENGGSATQAAQATAEEEKPADFRLDENGNVVPNTPLVL